MDVTFLYLDESNDLDAAWLTGIFVPAAQYPDVRDAVVRLAQRALIASGQSPNAPTELHGVDLLRRVEGATDEHRLQVFTEAVEIVNRARLRVLSVGHVAARNVRQNLRQVLMDPGEKLYTLNFQEIVETLDLPSNGLVLPVFDGVPGRESATKAHGRVDKFAYEAFLLGGSVTHWNRVALEDSPVHGIRHKANLRNLAEPTFSDSSRSPLLQLSDLIGYLLSVGSRVEQTPASSWKARVAEAASKLDPSLVHRRSVRISFSDRID